MRAICALIVLLLGSAAYASETIAYTYDALGRLVQVSRSGTVNNGASAAYNYDPANNRTNVTTSAPAEGATAATQQRRSNDASKPKTGAANGAHR